MQRVQLIVNAATPYRIPLFNELYDQLLSAGYYLQVVFGCASYERRKWHINLEQCRFPYVVLNSRSVVLEGDVEQTMCLYGGLLRAIRSFEPGVIIVAGFSTATVKVWFYTRLRRIPYIIWSGSIGLERRRRKTLRTLQRRLLAKSASAGIAYGTRAKEYLVNLGMPAESVEIAINTVDVTFFQECAAEARRTLERPGPTVLTYVGYLSRRKNVRKVLELVELLARQRADFVLDIVGDGEDRPSLEAYVDQRGLGRVVRFHGYRQRSELPTFLAASRCLLFQTDFDVWGLIVVEAMASGVPVAASVNAGATYDLIRDGENGLRVDFEDVVTTAARIGRLLDHPEEAAAMGDRARNYIAQHAALEHSAMGAVRAVQAVSATPSMRGSVEGVLTR